MTKQEIEAVLVKNAKLLVPELANSDIDVTQTYSVIGVDSMDMLEVATKTIRDLGVTIGLTELGKTKTISETAEVLFKAQGA